MARYDITPEGAEALRNLGRDLLKSTNDMLEQDQMLKRKIHSLENDLEFIQMKSRKSWIRTFRD